MRSKYQEIRDEYLEHVELCKLCNRNKYSHLGWTLKHWTLVNPCSKAKELLLAITSLF